MVTQIIGKRRCEEVLWKGKDIVMISCPFCDQALHEHTPEGWICICGETIPFGFERDSSEECETCPVLRCPRRK